MSEKALVISAILVALALPGCGKKEKEKITAKREDHRMMKHHKKDGKENGFLFRK